MSGELFKTSADDAFYIGVVAREQVVGEHDALIRLKRIDEALFLYHTSMTTPNRFSTAVSVEIQSMNGPDTCMHFGDLQQAYIWVCEFMNANGTEWTDIPQFTEFANRLDAEVVGRGVRHATFLICSPSIQLSVFYGKLEY